MNSENPVPPNPQPGWYELTGEPDIERYWDGVQWTEHVRVKERVVRWTTFSPFVNTRLWKWYGLGLCVILVVFALFSSFEIKQSIAVSSVSENTSAKEVCSEVLNFEWYKLNTRQFMNNGDASARQANALFLKSFLDRDQELILQDRRLFDILNNVSMHVDDVANARIWEDASDAGTQADTAFVELAEYCSDYLPNATAPVLSEATENTSVIDDEAKQFIPESYIDNGEGIAYALSPGNTCMPGQYGCTSLEIYAYKDCPMGVMVYANLFDAGGKEVARTDGRTEGLVAGQSAVLMLSTGLSTANSATVSKLVCE